MGLFSKLKQFVVPSSWNASEIEVANSKISDDVRGILVRGFEKQFITPYKKIDDTFIPQFNRCKVSGDAINPKDLIRPVPVKSGVFLERAHNLTSIGHCFECRFTGRVCYAKDCPGTHPENYEVVGGKYVKSS